MTKKNDNFRVAMLLKELYSKTMHSVENDFRGYNLTHQQIILIKFIAHNKELTISQLCEKMQLSKGTVSGIVTRLEYNGFIQKFKKDTDQRNTYIKFTKEGNRFADDFKDTMKESFDTIFENCTQKEIDDLAESLRKVLAKIK